jgi:hypothetical protein
MTRAKNSTQNCFSSPRKFQKIRAACHVASKTTANETDAHMKLSEWSKIVKNDFDLRKQFVARANDQNLAAALNKQWSIIAQLCTDSLNAEAMNGRLATTVEARSEAIHQLAASEKRELPASPRSSPEKRKAPGPPSLLARVAKRPHLAVQEPEVASTVAGPVEVPALGSLAAAVSDSSAEHKNIKLTAVRGWLCEDGQLFCNKRLERTSCPRVDAMPANTQPQLDWSNWPCLMIQPKNGKLKTLISQS